MIGETHGIRRQIRGEVAFSASDPVSALAVATRRRGYAASARQPSHVVSSRACRASWWTRAPPVGTSPHTGCVSLRCFDARPDTLGRRTEALLVRQATSELASCPRRDFLEQVRRPVLDDVDVRHDTAGDRLAVRHQETPVRRDVVTADRGRTAVPGDRGSVRDVTSCLQVSSRWRISALRLCRSHFLEEHRARSTRVVLALGRIRSHRPWGRCVVALKTCGFQTRRSSGMTRLRPGRSGGPSRASRFALKSGSPCTRISRAH